MGGAHRCCIGVVAAIPGEGDWPEVVTSGDAESEKGGRGQLHKPCAWASKRAGRQLRATLKFRLTDLSIV